jgi:tryptophanyl-tRNA synthetase
VPYHYLRFFLEDDVRLEEIRAQYGKGVMMTSEVKKELINVLTKVITEHQKRRALVTDEEVKKFMELRPLANYPPKKKN